MICTVTPNPSVDRTLEVAALTRGEVLRAHAASTDPGGKGVNVSRALHANGAATVAVLPVGGADGAHLTALLDEHGVPAVRVPVTAPTRSNVTIVDNGGITTKVNVAGPELTSGEIDALLAAVSAQLDRRPRWLVASGSLPAGAPVDLYVRMVDLARRAGIAVAVDSSGAALDAAARAGSIDLLKPNEEELAELAGTELSTVGDVRAAARRLIAWGNRTVLVTLGRHGALLVEREHTWWAGGPRITPRSSVGAGDCALAGYLSAAETTGPAERLRTAVAWGTAAAALPSSTVPGPGDPRPHEVDLIAEPNLGLVVKELCAR